jgi:hypothetical protein
MVLTDKWFFQTQGGKVGQQTATESDTYMSKTKDKPVHQVKFGLVKAAIWANETDKGVMYNVTFTRVYKDKSNEWAYTDSFNALDCLLVAKVADAAHTWISQQGKNKDEDPQD